MIKNSNYTTESWTWCAQRWQTIIFVLALLLGLGNAGQTRPVQAQANQQRTETVYGLEVLAIQTAHRAICVGFDYDIRVKVSKHTKVMAENGEVLGSLDSRGVQAVVVGSVSDPGVGTLNPTSQETGWNASSTLPDVIVFSFHANKAGRATLNFIGRGEGQEMGDYLNIEVENCSYTVTMTAFSVFLDGDVNIWTVGRMQTEVADKNGRYEGAGTLKLNSGFGGDPCKISYSLYQAPTAISGPPIENDILKLKFTFEPAQLTNQVTCPDAGGSGSHTIDLNSLNLPEFRFPPEGGTTSVVRNNGGSTTTVIVNVQLKGEQDP